MLLRQYNGFQLRNLNNIQEGGNAVKPDNNKSKPEELFDYSRLRGRIRMYFSTQAAFAEAISMSESSLSKKLNGWTEWDAGEIRRTREVLEIPEAEIHLYFFCSKS